MMDQRIREAIALEEALFERWEADKSNRLGEIWQELKKPYVHLYTDWHLGDDVGAGWWEDILAAFEQISQLMAEHQDYQFVVHQIKEKFGALRFYFSVHHHDESLNEWPRKEDPVKDELYQRVRLIVRELENKCENMCEVCGQPGEPRDGRWIKTLCDKHAKVKNERDKA